MDQQRRRTLVTGGGRRIGAAIVRWLAQAGHDVAIHCRRSGDAAEALAAEVRDAGTAVAVIRADLADAEATAGIIPQAREALGGALDGLVNCASLFEFDRPPEVTRACFAALSQVNVAAPVQLACAFARQDDLEGGAIVNVLDQKLANLNPDFFSYTLTKAALASATDMLGVALAPRVRVNAVAPGLSLPSADQSPEEFAQVARENLLQRAIDPAEIGRAVAFLLSARGIAGQIVFVDNGQRFLARDSDVMFEHRRRA